MNKLYPLCTRKHFNNSIGILRLSILFAIFLPASNAGWAQLVLTSGAPSATIDFSNTMQATVGTNTSTAFTAAGFSVNPTNATPGRLNSNAWAFTGWSDGDLAFGGTQATLATDYTRGPIAAAVTQGGIYAYTGAPNSVADPALMMQPVGADFTPGTMTLKIKNTDGISLMNQLIVSYDIYVRNDNARSQSFNFSYSTDNITYTPVPAMDYSTPTTADGAGWVRVGAIPPSRTTTITGISIIPGSNFYIRWTSDDISGAGARDEIGLDNITCTGSFVGSCTPPTLPASLNGINNLLSRQMDLDFLRGNGTGGLLIVATQGGVALSSNPVSGVTYHANSNYGTGAAIGNGFVVYNSNIVPPLTSGTCTITGLLPNTQYDFYYFEYNISVPCYDASPNTDYQPTNPTSTTNAGDQFRSLSNGDWANAFTWQSNSGSGWGPADIPPTSASAGIAVQITHTVDVSCPVSMDQVGIAGTLTLSDDGVINLNNGAGADIDILSGGILRTQTSKNYSSGFVYTGGPLINVSTGGKITLGNGGSAPGYSALGYTSGLVVWNDASILEWNSTDPFATSGFTYFPDAAAGTIPIFRVSRSPSLQPGAIANTTWKGLMEVNANLTLKLDGIKTFRNGIIGTANLFQDDLCGQFVIDGVTAQLGGTGSLNLNAGGGLINTGSLTSMISDKTVNQTAGLGTLTVNGSLYCSNYIMSGSSVFTLSPGGTLGIGSGGGISTGASGNIQVGGARTFDVAANYIYNGTFTQITGDGLPATVNTLTIANTGGAGNNTVSNTRTGTTTINAGVAGSFALSSGLFSIGSGNNISIADNGGIAATAGDFSTTSSGSVTFLGTGLVSGTVNFYPDVYQTPPGVKGVNYGSSSIVHGLLQLNVNSFVNLNAPTYVSGSLLKYNTGGTYGRRVEWSAGAGNGFPYQVQVSNNTTLSPAVNAGYSTTVFKTAGNVTIDNGSAIYLDEGGFNMTVPLTVGGNLLINGAISGSQVIGGDIVVAGNWTRSSTGSFFPNNRAVFFNGSGNSTITANNGEVFDYLYFTKNAVGNTVSLIDDISVRKEFGMNTGTLDLLNKNVTLVSSATATANFANFGAGTPANASINYSGTGRFVAERFIPIGTGGSNHGKSWQFLGIPTKGQTVNESWQEGNAPLVVGTAGRGIIISSNTAGAGFDIIGGVGPSMKTYNSAGAGSWVGIANTTSLQIADPKGYMVFVRGDRTVTAYNQTATPTTIRTTGKLYAPGAEAPSVTNVVAGKYESIGNPYASAIDFTLVTKPAAPDVDDAFYVWDPLLPGSFNLGGYQTISSVNLWKPTPGGTANYNAATVTKTIQSGQAFFVHATNAGGNVSFTEACKVSGSSIVYRPVNMANRAFLRTDLYTGPGNNANIADGNVVAFDNAFNNGYDANDALKLMNEGENFGIVRNGKILSVEARKPAINKDTIFYYFSNLRKQTYEFRFFPENMHVAANIEAFLIDRHLNNRTRISLNGATVVTFAVNNDRGSSASNRFMLVFKRGGHSSEEFAGIEAGMQSRSSSEKVYAGFVIYPNPVKDGLIGLHISQMPAGTYSLKLYNSGGQIVLSKNLYHTGENSTYNIQAGPGLGKGVYRLEINGAGGVRHFEKLLLD